MSSKFNSHTKMSAPETLADIAGLQDDLFGSIPDFEHDDPLLDPGAFIHDTETLIDPVQPREPVHEPDLVQPPEEPVQNLAGDPAASETEFESPVPLKIVLPETMPEKTPAKRGRRKKSETSTEVVIAAVNPDWMPKDWHVEERARVSGASAGATDKYYCDPVSGHKFRSKVEAVYFLETGSRRKRKDKMDDEVKVAGSSEKKQKQKKPRKSTKGSKFDFDNVPEKISWVLTDNEKGTWTPYVGDKEVDENSKKEWAATFTSLCTKNGNVG